MTARKYLVGVVAVVLLIYGPIDRTWPMWLLIRIAYLVVIPTVAWYLLRWAWMRWCPDDATEQRLNRTLAGVTAGVLLVCVILAAQTKHHFVCTEEVGSGDGRECVGDYVRVPGPDLGGAFMLTIAAGFAFWLSVRRE